jgi:SAM-dependent methyltransferase
VPLLMTLLRPGSVVDVGCGIGSWLSVFRDCGVHDVTGVDGDYVPVEALQIPQDAFRSADLNEPLCAGRSFDLVVSLEVAEHLPPESASRFVESLCALGPAILFSAAVPFQGGTGHCNEQWPEYWAELFEARGFVAVDCIRPRVWHAADVDWWYAQNALLYLRPDGIHAGSALEDDYRRTRRSALARVHPRSWIALNRRLEVQRDLPQTVSDLERVIPDNASFVLVDHAVLHDVAFGDRVAIPFLERDGEYWGMPADGAAAIAEVERQRARGARFIAFYSVGFWCLDRFQDFAAYLRSRFPVVVENERVIVFSLHAADVPHDMRS